MTRWTLERMTAFLRRAGKLPGPKCQEPPAEPHKPIEPLSPYRLGDSRHIYEGPGAQ